jgi:chromosome segregation ATPase
VLAPKVEAVEAEFSREVSVTPEIAIAAVAAPAPVAPKPKSKKRRLTPEEEAAEVVAKRAKNTDAARRSRLKKLIKLEGLEAKAFDLESANSDLNMRIAILETEKSGFLAKEAEQAARIAQLEAQLAEAHATLSSRA